VSALEKGDRGLSAPLYSPRDWRKSRKSQASRQVNLVLQLTMTVQSAGVLADVTEEHTASTFRVKTQTKQQATSRASIPTIEDKYAGFQVYTAVTMNSIALWDVTPCCPVVHSRLAATFLHVACLASCEDGGRVLPKLRWTSIGHVPQDSALQSLLRKPPIKYNLTMKF
jgi:hypothetical protein